MTVSDQGYRSLSIYLHHLEVSAAMTLVKEVGSDPKLKAHARADDPESERSVDAGDSRLQQLGYKQEFVRGFSTFTNFGISFSVMSLLTGVTGASAKA